LMQVGRWSASVRRQQVGSTTDWWWGRPSVWQDNHRTWLRSSPTVKVALLSLIATQSSGCGLFYRCSVGRLCVYVCHNYAWAAKTDEPLEILFWVWTRVGSRDHVLGEARIPHTILWASPGRLWDLRNIRREPKLFGRWQQRCGLLLSVLQQLVWSCYECVELRSHRMPCRAVPWRNTTHRVWTHLYTWYFKGIE